MARAGSAPLLRQRHLETRQEDCPRVLDRPRVLRRVLRSLKGKQTQTPSPFKAEPGLGSLASGAPREPRHCRLPHMAGTESSCALRRGVFQGNCPSKCLRPGRQRDKKQTLTRHKPFRTATRRKLRELWFFRALEAMKAERTAQLLQHKGSERT